MQLVPSRDAFLQPYRAAEWGLACSANVLRLSECSVEGGGFVFRSGSRKYVDRSIWNTRLALSSTSGFLSFLVLFLSHGVHVKSSRVRTTAPKAARYQFFSSFLLPILSCMHENPFTPTPGCTCSKKPSPALQEVRSWS